MIFLPLLQGVALKHPTNLLRLSLLNVELFTVGFSRARASNWPGWYESLRGPLLVDSPEWRGFLEFKAESATNPMYSYLVPYLERPEGKEVTISIQDEKGESGGSFNSQFFNPMDYFNAKRIV